ncbi:MAG: hypothetical protein J6X78_00115 [Treponema sp.]|nr:hypothetical protein [Treponema sp.]
MKNLIISAICGLIVGILCFGMTVLVCVPCLMLAKFGVWDVINGTGNLEHLVSCICSKQGLSLAGAMSTDTLILISVQIALCLALSVTAYIFLSKVMKVHLPKQEYFRHLYNVVFFILFFVPEFLVILAIFFRFPVKLALILIGVIIAETAAFATIMSNKILPDLLNNEREQKLFKTED